MTLAVCLLALAVASHAYMTARAARASAAEVAVLLSRAERAWAERHRLAVAYRDTSGAIVAELTQGEIFAARMRLSEGLHGR